MASCVQRPVDVVFLLDGSERMGLENHRRAKEFIENVARRLTLANGQSDERNARFALLQYGSPSEQRVEFPLTHNLTVISDSLARVTYMDSSSALGNAIIHAVNNIVYQSGAQVLKHTLTHIHSHFNLNFRLIIRFLKGKSLTFPKRIRCNVNNGSCTWKHCRKTTTSRFDLYLKVDIDYR